MFTLIGGKNSDVSSIEQLSTLLFTVHVQLQEQQYSNLTQLDVTLVQVIVLWPVRSALSIPV